MTNNDFLEKAWSPDRTKLWGGFSRPLFHNLMGILHGYKYGKKEYGA